MKPITVVMKGKCLKRKKVENAFSWLLNNTYIKFNITNILNNNVNHNIRKYIKILGKCQIFATSSFQLVCWHLSSSVVNKWTIWVKI